MSKLKRWLKNNPTLNSIATVMEITFTILTGICWIVFLAIFVSCLLKNLTK